MRSQRLWRLLRRMSLTVLLTALTALFSFLTFKAIPALNRSLLFGSSSLGAALRGRPVWDGLWPACVGTLSLLGCTMALTLPLGLGCGTYLALSRSPAARAVTSCLRLLASIPSILLGLFGFEFLLFLRNVLAFDAVPGLWLAALCLTLLVLAPFTLTVKTALETFPIEKRLAVQALGFSKKDEILRFWWPECRRALSGACALALGRAAEDTAVIMLTGAVVSGRLPRGLTSKFDALPFFIYYKSGQYLDQADLSRAFAAALLLCLFSAGTIALSHLLLKGGSAHE